MNVPRKKSPAPTASIHSATPAAAATVTSRPISRWPESERPREKLLERGVASLSDAELLAIFLRTGTAGVSAVDLARSLLEDTGGLRRLLALEPAAMSAYPGIGPAKSAQLAAALELGRRYLAEQLHTLGPLQSPAQAADYLQSQLRDRVREVFAILYLDSRHQVVHYEELFHGTIDGATVHPREVVRGVIRHNAAAVIVAHNHPSGVAEPSTSDTAITTKLRRALALIDVKLLDHLVIGNGHYVSFEQRGLL